MPEAILEELQPMIDTVCQLRNKVCVIVAIGDPANDVIDDCAIPSITTMEMLECIPGLKHILKQRLSENLMWQKVHIVTFQHLMHL